MTDFRDGEVLLIDKPLRWTSFDVVKKVKGIIQRSVGKGKIKVGHAGTLDPLATGLLILCTGRKTKIIPTIQDQPKEYTGTFCLGAVTPSYDLETEPENFKSPEHITEQKLKETAEKFLGSIEQKPPIYSAVKYEGKRAYEYARKGKHVELKSKKISIELFEITSINMPEVEFKIRCSKGTYIRSIANDFGAQVGVGAYLKELRRTCIGDYNVADALTIDTIGAGLNESGET